MPTKSHSFKPTISPPRWPAAPFAVLTVCLLLAACASPDTLPTQENIDRANLACEQQVKADQQESHPAWFSRWVGCRSEKIMGYEIKIMPSKEAEIRAMYSQIARLAPNVDAGNMAVQTVYAQWDQIASQIGLRKCLIRITQADGSSQCANQR